MSAIRSLRRGALGLVLSLAACEPVRAPPAVAEGPRPKAVPEGAISAIAGAARPIEGTASDYSDILAAGGGSSRILLGESTHGTHEFYRERARISRRLIEQHGVGAVAIEGDWSPTWRVNLYVRGLGADSSAEQALSGFTRFPDWMWPNSDFRDFVEWLRAWNLERPAAERVGLYGMDVYDLYEAADAAVVWLSERDAAAAARAQSLYRCFRPYRGDTGAYGEATQGGRVSCREEAEAVVAEVGRMPRPRDPIEAERHFAAVRAAASVAAAEDYFRTAYAGSLAWNVRDRRMERNVEEIAGHVASLSGRPGKVVIWGHNSHVGDARATSAANRGELNLGQLMRQRHGASAFLIGFFSYEGRVFAAPEWDRPGRVYAMRPALPGSYSASFRETGLANFSLLIRGNEAVRRALAGPMLERAIGVVYLPESERLSHYFDARLAEQFDAAIFFDRSTAVAPLRR
ncbi:erythromycin esterase family protein [Allosphingosinicella sp.]|jgi:erythromycin esterase-like protein|uniref:erythromycin esterase family protein n=1 Tax=Allosphingosinicella sp. TaxID=2823234 RepID=UPI002F0DDE4C